MKKTLFLLAIAGVWFAHWHLHGPITYSPGVLIESDPIQVDLPGNEPEFTAYTILINLAYSKCAIRIGPVDRITIAVGATARAAFMASRIRTDELASGEIVVVALHPNEARAIRGTVIERP